MFSSRELDVHVSEDAAERSCVLWTDLCVPTQSLCVEILAPRVMALEAWGPMRMEPKRGSRGSPTLLPHEDTARRLYL